MAWVMDERAAAKQKSVRAQARAEMYRWDTSCTRYLDVLHGLQIGRVEERV